MESLWVDALDALEHGKQLVIMLLTLALGGGVEAAAPAVRVVAVHTAVNGVALRGRRAARQGRVQGLGSRSSWCP